MAWPTSTSALAATSARGAAAPTRTRSSPSRTTCRSRGSRCRRAPTASTSSPGKDEWTIVFSKNYTSWGSFYLRRQGGRPARAGQAGEERLPRVADLRVHRARAGPSATAALKWEDLQLPFTITVDDPDDLYVDNIRQELRNSTGFSWQTWTAAAQYRLDQQDSPRPGVALGRGGGPPAGYRPGELHHPEHPGPAPGGERQAGGRPEDHGGRPDSSHGRTPLRSTSTAASSWRRRRTRRR